MMQRISTKTQEDQGGNKYTLKNEKQWRFTSQQGKELDS